MGELIKLLSALAVLFLLIGLAWLVAHKLGLLKPAKGEAVAKDGEAPSLGYIVRERVLSPAECTFLTALRQAVQVERAAPSLIVLASVRLAEVLAVNSPRSGNRSAWQTAFNRVASKQVDFVICDAATTRPVLVVELDDQSHERSERQERDGFVDRACRSAGLPILHVRAAARYDPQVLAKQIAEKLTAG